MYISEVTVFYGDRGTSAAVVPVEVTSEWDTSVLLDVLADSERALFLKNAATGRVEIFPTRAIVRIAVSHPKEVSGDSYPFRSEAE